MVPDSDVIPDEMTTPPARRDTDAVPPCPVCDGTPRVLVAIRHPAMRRYTRDLLQREYHCWVATEAADGQPLAEALSGALQHSAPDLLVVDTGEFPACCRAIVERFGCGRVIVIGPEPDPSYRNAALAAGAAACIPRERVADELGPAMRRALGCLHDPCPPGERRG
jgi:DNA-binding NarL/FixJ family response regulator